MITDVATDFSVKLSDWDAGALVSQFSTAVMWPLMTPEEPPHHHHPTTAPLSFNMCTGTVSGQLIVERVELILGNDVNPTIATIKTKQISRLKSPIRGSVSKMCCSWELGWFLYLVSNSLCCYEVDMTMTLRESRGVLYENVVDFYLKSETPRSTLIVLFETSLHYFVINSDNNPNQLTPMATIPLMKPCVSCSLWANTIICCSQSTYYFYIFDSSSLKLIHEKPTNLNVKDTGLAAGIFQPNHRNVEQAAIEEEDSRDGREILILQGSAHSFFRYKLSGVSCSSAVLDIRRTIFLVTPDVPPTAIRSVGPFLVCINRKCAEIYHLESNKLVQTISMTGSVGNSVPIVSDVDVVPSYMWDNKRMFNSRGQMYRHLLFFTESGAARLVSFMNLVQLEALLRKKGRSLTQSINSYLALYNVLQLTPCRSMTSSLYGPALSNTWFLPERALEVPLLLEPDHLRSEDHWEKDSLHSTCPTCNRSFSFLYRRQYCRQCGHVFCSSCCPVRKPEVLYGMGYVDDVISVGDIRLCETCLQWCDKNIYVLLVYERFYDALEYTRRRPELVVGYCENNFIGFKILEFLFQRRDFEYCAKLLTEVLGNNIRAWEDWVLHFFERRAIRILLPYLPVPTIRKTSDLSDSFSAIDVKLDSSIYTTVLCHLIQEDPELLYATVRKWKYEEGMFDIQGVLCTMEGYLSVRRQELLKQRGFDAATQEDNELVSIGEEYLSSHVEYVMRAALVLHRTVSTPEETLRTYVRDYFVFLPVEGGSHDPDADKIGVSSLTNISVLPEQIIEIGSYIESNNLWHVLLPPKSLLRRLMRRQRTTVVSLVLKYLARNPRLKVKDFVEQMNKYPKERLLLLHTLTEANVSSTSSYHNELVELYAKYMPEGLLGFLRHKDLAHIDWKAAADLTQQQRLFKEFAYIVGKMGNYEQSVRIITRCLKDIKYGLEYISYVGDDDRSLRESLICHALQSPILIGDVIEHVTDHPNLFSIVEFLGRIPENRNITIPRFGDRLTEAFALLKCDHQIYSSTVRSMMKHVLKTDRECVAVKSKAISVEVGDSISHSVCVQCNLVIQNPGDGIFVGGCGHSYHAECFRNLKPQKVIRSKTRRPNAKSDPTGLRIPSFTSEALYRMNEDVSYLYIHYITGLECEFTDPFDLLPYTITRFILTFLSKEELLQVVMMVKKSWYGLTLDSLFGPFSIHSRGSLGHNAIQLRPSTFNPVNKYFRKYFAPFVDVRPIISNVQESNVVLVPSKSLFKENFLCSGCKKKQKW
eukprot:PhF_6_TR23839/c0_g1_i1/m.33434/K20184/VPS41; vacuolar protein sorting-associated protein 41